MAFSNKMTGIVLSDNNLDYIVSLINGKRELFRGDIESIIKGNKNIEKTLLESNHQVEIEATAVLGSQDPLQQQLLRETIVGIIEEKLGLSINYEKLGYNYQKLVKGAKARIRPDSRFSNQNSGIGTLTEGFRDARTLGMKESWANVLFEDGYKNRYRPEDLELIIDKNAQKKNSKHNAAVLDRVSKTSFDNFKQHLTDALVQILKNNDNIRIIDSKREFKPGDLIIMNGKANRYDLSKEGSEGKVIRKGDDKTYEVHFTKLTGDLSRQPDFFVVNQEFMSHNVILKDYIKRNGGLKGYSRKIIEESIRYVIAKEVKHKIIHQNTEKLIDSLVETGLIIKSDNKLFVNDNGLLKFVAPKLAKAYSDPEIYSSPDMFSPPSERRPHVLRLELTTGCDYGKCTYCNGFKGIRFSEKTYEEFMEHYKAVLGALGNHRRNIRRLFIGGGNALSAKQETLLRVLARLESDFNYERIATYGRADTIVEKGVSQLKSLASKGMTLIYWGIESGSNEVLAYTNKGTAQEEMLRAGEIADEADVKLSVMIMPGLGGIKHYDSHVAETASLLNKINTKFITFMAINASPDSAYSRRMRKEIVEGTNRPLTQKEIVEQVRDMIGLMKPRGQKIGMFDCGIDQVGQNPIAFNRKLYDSGDRREIVKICNSYA